MTHSTALLPPIPVARPLFGTEEFEAVREALEERWVGAGPRGVRFEAGLARACGVAEAVALSSGTAALHLALLGLGVGPGDTVAVPSFTFVATANAVVLCGATPLLIDCDPATFNLDVEDLRRKVAAAGGVRAILPVDQFGLPYDVEGVAQVAQQWGALVLEDAACALGASAHGRPAGSFGRAGCLSFHPRKIITTGEGGAVVTDDHELAARLRMLRSHGMDPQRSVGGGLADVVLPGYNYRLSDLQAALGLAQLERVAPLQARREALAAGYRRALESVPWLALPAAPAETCHGWQSYVVRVISQDLASGYALREGLRHELDARGIATRPGTHAVHGLQLYRERFGYQVGDLPGAWEADRLALALPLYAELDEASQQRVASELIAAGARLGAV